MENEITNTPVETEITFSITADGKSYLNIVSKWAFFLSILGFIGTGFIVMAGIAMMFISPLLGNSSKFGSTLGFPVILFSIVYLIFGVLYFFPSYYLYNFANKMKLSFLSSNQQDFDNSLNQLKKTFKFLGISAIVILSLYLLIILVMLYIGLSKNMGF